MLYYFILFLCNFVVYSLQYSETFDVSHVFLLLSIAELSMLKQVRLFWPTLCCVWVVCKSYYRASKLSTVYAKYDYLSEEVSMAVYRVQVLWYLRHFRQWC